LINDINEIDGIRDFPS